MNHVKDFMAARKLIAEGARPLVVEDVTGAADLAAVDETVAVTAHAGNPE